MNRYGLIVIMLILTAGIAGCTASYPTAKPPLRNADVYPDAQTIAGLTVAVDEISNSDRVRHYFGTDLTDDDILPVNVVVSNHGDDRFLIRPADILMMEGNSVIDAMPLDEVRELVKDRGRPVADLAMQETVVPPLGNYQGILFFKIKRTDPGLYAKVEKIFTGRLSMRVVVTNQDSGERIRFGPYSLSGF